MSITSCCSHWFFFILSYNYSLSSKINQSPGQCQDIRHESKPNHAKPDVYFLMFNCCYLIITVLRKDLDKLTGSPLISCDVKRFLRQVWLPLSFQVSISWARIWKVVEFIGKFRFVDNFIFVVATFSLVLNKSFFKIFW